MSNQKKLQTQQTSRMNGPVNLNTEKPRDFKKTIKRILGVFIKPHKVAIASVIALTILATVFAIISPKILGNMTNQIVDDFISIRVYDMVQDNLPSDIKLPSGVTLQDLNTISSGEFNTDSILDNIPSAQRELIENLDLSEQPVFHFDKLTEIAIFLIILYLFATLANYISGWVASGIIMQTVRSLRQDISKKINRMQVSYFDKTPYGDVLSRITNDVDTIGQTLSQAFSQVISAVILLIGVLIMMLTINWLLTVVAITVVIVSFASVALIAKHSQRHFSDVQNKLGDINGFVEENYAGQLIIKAFSAEEKKQLEFAKLNQDLFNSGWRSQFFSGLMMPIMNFIGNLGYVATAVLGGWMAINGRLNIGSLQAFIQYVNQLQQPISQVGQMTTLFQSTAAAAERVFEFLDEPEELQEEDQLIDNKNKKVKGRVEFKNVSFGYDSKKEVIKNFSTTIKSGQKVAIVGPTGAGKTTIVNLLMRFYDPNKGQILIDGVDSKNMSRKKVRSLFGMVLQDTWLFEGSILENLAYGDLNANRDQIKGVAKAAHVDHFVRSLPDSYDTHINEDSDNISVGEKQLLTIARAMLADAPMLILDEATSNVDTRTEVLIQKAMSKLMEGRTSFVIAHRLSTIKDADLILVMQNGNIVEQGNHEKLLQKDGFYAKLYNSQFAK